MILQRPTHNQNQLLSMPRTGEAIDAGPAPHLSCDPGQVFGRSSLERSWKSGRQRIGKGLGEEDKHFADITLV